MKHGSWPLLGRCCQSSAPGISEAGSSFDFIQRIVLTPFSHFCIPIVIFITLLYSLLSGVFMNKNYNLNWLLVLVYLIVIAFG